MGYANDSGYTPSTIDAIMDDIRLSINTQFGTSYTSENFVGTNFYKYFYAIAQKCQENEIKTSEIFLKLQGYFAEINAMISRPVTTPNGFIEKMGLEGWLVSMKSPSPSDAGKIHICVDVDELGVTYAADKLEICQLIAANTAAGMVTQGSEVESITLTNGQSFDFKYNLPNRLTTLLRLTLTVSENNQNIILSPEDTKLLLMENISNRYALGKNFEPQKYFSTTDAPWAESVLLEWSTDAGSTWSDLVYDAAYDDLFEIALEDITLIEA